MTVSVSTCHQAIIFTTNLCMVPKGLESIPAVMFVKTKKTFMHTLTHRQFRLTFQPNMHVFELWEEAESLLPMNLFSEILHHLQH